jgi:hypothetical protein
VRNSLFNESATVIGERRFQRCRIKFWIKVFGQNGQMIPGTSKQLLTLLGAGPYSRMKLMRRYTGPVAALVAVKKSLAYKLHGPHNRRVCHHKHIGVRHRIGIWVTSEGRRDRLRCWRWTTGSVLGFCFQWDRRTSGR